MSGNTLSRSLHDLTAAAWFGGTLMGAVGVNGAAAAAKDPTERTRLASVGWAKWTPIQAAALVTHAGSLLPILWDNKGRFAAQDGVMRLTWLKAGLTAAGAGASAYAGMLGKKVADLSHEGGVGVTEPLPGASSQLQSAQKQLQVVQWIVPALAGSVVVLGSVHGEKQRVKNLAPKKLGMLGALTPVALKFVPGGPAISTAQRLLRSR